MVIEYAISLLETDVLDAKDIQVRCNIVARCYAAHARQINLQGMLERECAVGGARDCLAQDFCINTVRSSF